MRSSTSATLLGAGAIVLWTTLASLTVLEGAIPPFQTTAIAFAIGGIVLIAAGRRAWAACFVRPTPRLACARHLRPVRLPRALFCRAQAGPAGRSQPDHLAVGPVHGAVLGPAAGQPTAPAAPVGGALLGLAAATLLVWDKLGAAPACRSPALGFVLAFGCALVWSSYSVASRLFAAVPSESIAAPASHTARLACVSSLRVRDLGWPPSGLSWLALMRSRPRPGRRRLPALGHRHEGRRRVAAGRALLCLARPLHRPAGALRLACASLELGLACALMVIATAIATRA